MKTIQMTLDEDLIMEVDAEVKKLKTSRSAFTREALRKLLTYYHTLELEKKQQEGYRKNPATDEEFKDWENEQIWVDR